MQYNVFADYIYNRRCEISVSIRVLFVQCIGAGEVHVFVQCISARDSHGFVRGIFSVLVNYLQSAR